LKGAESSFYGLTGKPVVGKPGSIALFVIFIIQLSYNFSKYFFYYAYRHLNYTKYFYEVSRDVTRVASFQVPKFVHSNTFQSPFLC